MPPGNLIERGQHWLQRRGVSLLTLRILALNLLAVMILGAGILYLNQYKQQLIDREQESLRIEARILAAMIAEGATNDPGENTPILSQNAGRQMVRRLSETTRSRAQLYDRARTLMADSHLLVGGIGIVEIEPLTPIAEYDVRLQRVRRWLGLQDPQNTLVGFPSNLDLSPAIEKDVSSALNGGISGSMWFNNETGRLIFTMAAPVQRLKQVLGAVMLVRDGAEIDLAMKKVRSSILQLVIFSLFITTALSLYLASSIDQPIRKLARAADMMRRNPGRTHHIPDFSHRYDEIGDLSVALREMTEAIWARMDAVEAFAADVNRLAATKAIVRPQTSARPARRLAFFPCLREWFDTPVLQDSELLPGASRQGPALIEQSGSTVVVGPGDLFFADKLGNIHVSLSAEAMASGQKPKQDESDA